MHVIVSTYVGRSFPCGDILLQETGHGLVCVDENPCLYTKQ